MGEVDVQRRHDELKLKIEVGERRVSEDETDAVTGWFRVRCDCRV
jgi:hypothetical protein